MSTNDDKLEIRTLTGKTWGEVYAATDEPLPPVAYKRKPGGADLTSINTAWAYPLMTQLFGPRGYGWGMDWSDEQMVVTRNGKEFDAQLHNAKVWVKVIIRRGDVQSEIRLEETVNGGSRNFSEEDARRGARTNAMGDGLYLLVGWQRSVYMGLRSHSNIGQQQPQRQQRRTRQTPPPPPQQPAPTPQRGPFAFPQTAAEVITELRRHLPQDAPAITDAQRGLVVGCLQHLTGSTEEAKRVWLTITGLESTRDPQAAPWIKVLLDWLNPTKRGTGQGGKKIYLPGANEHEEDALRAIVQEILNTEGGSQ